MEEFQSGKPLVIYRIPSRTGRFRSFGLFCLGHSLLWGGMAWAWYTGRGTTNIGRVSSNYLRKSLLKDDKPLEPIDKPEFAKSIEAKMFTLFSPIQKQFEQIRESNATSVAEFSDKFQPYVSAVSDFFERNRRNLLCCFATLIACTTLLTGYFLPRRVARQLALLPLRSSAQLPHGSTTSKTQQLVEINTYDAFGLRSQCPSLTVPISSITTEVDRKNKGFIFFRVKNHLFPFVLQTEDAEFPEPEEFEYTFVLGSKK